MIQATLVGKPEATDAAGRAGPARLRRSQAHIRITLAIVLLYSQKGSRIDAQAESATDCENRLSRRSRTDIRRLLRGLLSPRFASAANRAASLSDRSLPPPGVSQGLPPGAHHLVGPPLHLSQLSQPPDRAAHP